MDSTQRCLLVMSGKSTRGNADRFCGYTDPPLSSEGRSAVLALRQSLSEAGERLPKTWYVSDRRRTSETFEIMSAGMHMPVVRLTESLREINFGDYENLTWEELPIDFQRQYESSLKQPMDLKFPGGESFRDMCNRVTKGALEILSYDQDSTDLAIVGHQGSLRIWNMMIEDLPPEAFFKETPEMAKANWVRISLSQVAKWRRTHLDPMNPGNG